METRKPAPPNDASTAVAPTTNWMFLAAGAVLGLALLVRLPAMLQSLWYDEMYTLIHYVLGSWGNIVGGAYSPNNHVLYTLLAKLMTLAVGDNAFDLALAIRLPSLLAGACAAVALAWPLRKERPGLALLIALLAALHPWLVSLSAWARGYALLLLLAIVATHLLPKSARAVHWPYVIALVAALYTQPIALAVVIGHAAYMLVDRRTMLLTWVRSAAVAGLITGGLYAAFLATGAREYWSRPDAASMPYARFLHELLPHAHAGMYVGGLAIQIPPLLAMIGGGALAWRVPKLRPPLVTFAAASAFAILFPLLVPRAGEVRAGLWLIPLYCIGASSLIGLPTPLRYVRWAAAVTLVAFLSLRTYVIDTVPAQPIAEAVGRARQLAGPDSKVIGVYTASIEAQALYGGISRTAYCLNRDSESQPMPTIAEAESAPGEPTVAIVFYGQMLREKQPLLWQYLSEHYTLAEVLPGRIAPAEIYKRKP